MDERDVQTVMTTLFTINDNVWFIRRYVEGEEDEEEEAGEEGDS